MVAPAAHGDERGRPARRGHHHDEPGEEAATALDSSAPASLRPARHPRTVTHVLTGSTPASRAGWHDDRTGSARYPGGPCYGANMSRSDEKMESSSEAGSSAPGASSYSQFSVKMRISAARGRDGVRRIWDPSSRTVSSASGR